jgi:hypothetical protein
MSLTHHHHHHPTCLTLRLKAATKNDAVIVDDGSENFNFNFNSFLFIVEFLYLASSLIGLVVNLAMLLSSKKAMLVELVGYKV